MRRNWTAGLAVGLAGSALLLGAGTAHAQARGGVGGGSSLGGGLGGSSLGGGLGGSSLGGGLGGSSGLGGSGGLGGSLSGGLGGGLGSGGLGGSSPFGGSSGVGFMGGGGGTFGISGGTSAGGRGGYGGTQGYGTTGPMGPYFGNPLSLGVPATTNTTNTTRTRTFGTLLYNVSNQNSTTSGFGGTAGVSSGRAMGASSFGTRRAPAYVTVLGDTVPPARADMLRVRADLQDVIARASRLPSRGTIRVLADGPTVVLRGNVANDRERRLAEALVRLSPGVRSVRNELVTPEVATAGTQP